jgi:hypothetical protein
VKYFLEKLQFSRQGLSDYSPSAVVFCNFIVFNFFLVYWKQNVGKGKVHRQCHKVFVSGLFYESSAARNVTVNNKIEKCNVLVHIK